MARLSSFLRDECGAVTIDWVALTAGVMVLAIAVVSAVYGGDGFDNTLSSIEESLTGIGEGAALAAVVIPGGGSVNPN